MGKLFSFVAKDGASPSDALPLVVEKKGANSPCHLLTPSPSPSHYLFASSPLPIRPPFSRSSASLLHTPQGLPLSNLFLQEANRSALTVYRLESGSNAPFQWNSTSGAMTVSMDNPTLGAPLSVFIVSYGGHDLQGSCSYQTLTSPQGDSKAMRITSVTIGGVTVALSGRQDPFTDLVTIPLRYTGSTLEVVR